MTELELIEKYIPYLETKILTDPYLGIYTVTSYYVNGHIDIREVHMGIIITPCRFAYV